DDDRRTSIVDVGMRFGSVGEALILGSRNAVPGHEGLGKILGALELRRRLGGAKDPQSRVPEVVHHAFGKRRFRTHDRKADAHASAYFSTHTCTAKATLLGKCTRWRVVTASGESAARR